MLLIQTPWKPATVQTDLFGVLTQALDTLVHPEGTVVLLSQASGGPNEALTESENIAELGGVAKYYNISLSGSAYERNGNNEIYIIGYLFGPDGSLLIRMPKIMPDLIEGFDNTTANTFTKSEFPIAHTKDGNVGILCGEDILSPHIVRALVLSGAEVILNPSRERADQHFSIRQKARQARAYENLSYVACASPSSVIINGVETFLPAATALSEMWGNIQKLEGNASILDADIDIEALRRRRQEPMGNFPAIVRTSIYASGYEKEGSESQSPNSRDAWVLNGQRKLSQNKSAVHSDHDMIDRYDVVLGQTVTRIALSPNNLIENRMHNLDNALRLTAPFSQSPGVKLVVFPEFFLTGPVSQLGTNSSAICDQIGMNFDGPEAEKIAEFARKNNVYVSGGVFEYDPKWPNRFFNTAFIFDDCGELVHRYRKIHCADVFGRLPDTAPGSVYTEYLNRYGYEYLFPVADTRIGKLCTVICFDMNFGETHRAMVKRGAEIIIHPTSEPHNMRRRGWDIARHVRAFENTAYLLTSGHGGEFRGEMSTFPGSMQRGYSKVVNYDGSLQCVADGPGSVPLVGSIDLKALRRARSDLKGNLVLWDNPIVYSHKYQQDYGIKNDIWAGDPSINPYEDASQIKRVIDRYKKEKIYSDSECFSKTAVMNESMQAVV